MSRFPGQKDFAFSIFDDTDNSTAENIGPVYSFLRDSGIRTTKSVWPLASAPGARFGGSTLQERDYLNYIHELQGAGYEIALHNVRSGSAPRAVVEQGLEEFRMRLGDYPRCHANHSDNRDNIYWGPSRLGRISSQLLYNLGTRFRSYGEFQGHVSDSIYFWGDLCRRRIRFVRNFVFDEINLDRINPTLPYHDPGKPFVNFWFSSCEGGNVDKFCHTLREANQDRLAGESGVCIMYTHFSSGFVSAAGLDSSFRRLMLRLSKLNGWFVPVSELLEFLLREKPNRNLTASERAVMENRWLQYKMRVGRG